MNLSIIIPTLNEAQHIGRLIDRLLTNKTNEIEIIVVDGGSGDGTLDIVQSKGISIIKTAPSRAIQMNAGAAAAQYQYLYFVHADTFPPEDYLEDHKIIINGPTKAGCYRSKFMGDHSLLKLNAFFTRFNWLVSRGGDQSLFIEKDYFNELGGFDESMVIMEEYPLIEKIMEQDQLKIIPKTIEISTRKYDYNSWLKVSRANYIAFKMYRKGICSKEIRTRYKSLLN